MSIDSLSFGSASADDLFGYAAAALVLVTFTMRSMRSLRIVAILSNVAFIVYAMRAGLMPVLVLHALLLPTNLLRLAQSERASCRRLARLSAPSTPTRERPAMSNLDLHRVLGSQNRHIIETATAEHDAAVRQALSGGWCWHWLDASLDRSIRLWNTRHG